MKVAPTNPGYFRLTPYGEQDQKEFTRDDQAHVRGLEWYQRTKAPVLYLTGVSGCGKSSLLAAYVVPKLNPETLVVSLRPSDNPIGQLRQVLLAAVWKSEQAKEHDADDLRSLLQAATKYLGQKGRKLLIVFDQFEELLVASATESSRDEVLNLLRSIVKGEMGSCRALLSFRVEFIGDLARCGLPYIDEQNNFLVEAFEEGAARGFLTKGFQELGPKLIDRVVAEAADLDNLAGRIRPITLNMVGQMLRQYPVRAEGVVVGPRPFVDYIRRVLNQNDIRDHAPRILRALLDDRNRRLQRTAEELAGGTEEDVQVVNGCLEQLALPSRGLVRCLNPGEADIPNRRWEVSHDFVAAVLAAALPAFEVTTWKRIRPWLAPAACVVWLATFGFLLPRALQEEAARRRNEVIARLSTEFGVQIVRKEADGTLAIKLDAEHPLSSLGEAVPLLNRLGAVSSLDAENHRSLKSLDRCGELASLVSLNLSRCRALERVDGLRGLTSLRTLDLTACRHLKNVNGLEGLTSLQTLDLGACRALESVDGLKGLTSLHTLDLSFCSVKNVNGLKGLTSLRTLHLSWCPLLQSVEGLEGLTSLQTLDLSACSGLRNLDGLKRLTSIRTLKLASVPSLHSVDILKGLTSLQTLDLNHCRGLVSVDGLKALPSLRDLDLSACNAVENLDVLKWLVSLQTLQLGNCNILKSVDVLKGLTSLQTLDLNHCGGLESVDGLKALPSLRHLDLSACNGLRRVDVPTELTSLQSLKLRNCNILNNVDVLQGLTSLQTLDLSFCPIKSAEGLRGLTSLRELDLSDCSGLVAVDVPKELASLQTLRLRNCVGLKNVDGLRGLTSLQTLDLYDCANLENVDGLKELKSLKKLDILGCRLRREQIVELHGCLSNTSIFPFDMLDELQHK